MDTSEGALPAGSSSGEQRRRLLSRKICDLPLSIHGTALQPLVEQLYAELEGAGISFRPRVYISDEWGCPDRVPIIGVPFYLPDPRICDLVDEMTRETVEGVEQPMMYLRHEAGHAFNYAYRIFAEPEWEQVFGPFSLAYRQRYRARPFSTRFVRHLPGWYAQSHPDEDFAESFAVWLTPDSGWREIYDGTPALAKLLYVERAAGRYGRQPPLVAGGDSDVTLGELDITVGEWCRMNRETRRSAIKLPGVVREDLRRLFPDSEGEAAADVLNAGSGQLLQEIYAWTGIDSDLLLDLVNAVTAVSRDMGLKVAHGKVPESLVTSAIFLTTLAMNFQTAGEFIET